MTTQPLSEAEIADTRRQHHEWKFGGGIVLCAACGSAYPCSTIRALDELTTLRTAHAAALEEIKSWYGERNLVAEAHSECRRERAEMLETVRAAVAAMRHYHDNPIRHDSWPLPLLFALNGSIPDTAQLEGGVLERYNSFAALVALAEGGEGNE